METRKLYYEDCHLDRFTARVLSCAPVAGGYAVTLDATAFYPEGGGQACDLGTLGGATVLDVREQGDSVIHLCDGPLPVGEMLEGCIDYARRFDLMQQHTGEHILSGIIHRRFGYHNVGFHMGADMLQIDFDGIIFPDSLWEIELEANRAVWADLPVRCWYPSADELPTVRYRTKRELPWPVRIVEVGDVDSCACCGVHTARTGEVGIIKIFSCVKFHQGVRLEMACGSRALQYLSRIFEQNRQVSQLFSAKPLETATAAQRINEQLAAEKFRSTGLERQLFDGIAAGYADQENVLHFEENLSPGSARELAQRIAERCTGIAAVIVPGQDVSHVCLARPGGDVKTLSSALSQALDCRGGGRNGFFQGTVHAPRDKIESFFLSQWKSS